jgi:hypothetical protein
MRPELTGFGRTDPLARANVRQIDCANGWRNPASQESLRSMKSSGLDSEEEAEAGRSLPSGK